MSRPSALERPRVAIVEDEGIVAMYLESLLTRWGYEVVATVASGEEAVTCASASSPDLMLMDIKLRGGLDGVEAARAIRASSHLPIVFLTAFSDERTLHRVGSSDAYGFVRKPLDERDLRIAVEMALYRHRADAALRRQKGWLDAALSSVSDGVIATDRAGRVRFMNPAAEELTGWSRERSFEHSLAEVLQPGSEGDEAAPTELVRSILSGLQETASSPCVTVARADGTEVSLELRAAPIRTDGDEPAGAVLLFHDVGEQRIREERLVRLAHHDPLTGLPSRLLFEERLGQAVAQARRSGRHVGLILLDLDRFKEINDRHGHTTGDRLLAAAGERVLESIRKTDTAARYGGDELAVVLPDLGDPTGAARAAAKLVAAFERPFEIDGLELTTTMSAGVAVFPRDGDDGSELIERADEALYGAKRSGRARAVISAGSDDEHEVARVVERDLRKALERGDLEVHYQPIFEAATGALAGAEALVRWRHPDHGLISAGDFLGTALRSGLIGTITDRVLEAACLQAADWNRQGLDLIVAVNLNDSQLLRRDLVRTVAAALAGSGLPPERLQLELAERTVVDRPSAVTVENIDGLRRLGARAALDDFGSSHAAMVSLRRLQFDLLKIDRSLVAVLPGDPAARAIVEAALTGAHQLGLVTAANGIEDEAQLEWLRRHGCRLVQGFLLGTACPADIFEQRYLSRPVERDTLKVEQ